MKLNKSLLAIPLSLSLLVPVQGAFAHDHVNHTKMSGSEAVATPAAELRSTLGHLLSEHAYLAVEVMRNGALGAKDFEASVGALNENTVDLSNAITSVYGDEAGQQFKQMWEEHIGFFVDYVTATAENDETKKEEALNNLDTYREKFSQFLETATGERLEASGLAEGLQMHVNQLVGAFDSYLAKDFNKAYEYEREAIHHMHMVAKGLSNAITDQFPEKFETTKAVTPAVDLRATLNHLLTEHAGLAVVAMQQGADGAEDFEAAAGALNANTEDLTAAIASVYGDEAGEQFKTMWSNHIGFFVDYVKATGANDENAKKEALENLDGYRAEFSKFLETATDGRLKSDALADGLQMHVEQLIAAFDFYVAGDYEKAYDSIREAYGHMLNPAKGLSGAFVDQFPEKFTSMMPDEMPKTGMGGTDDSMMGNYIVFGLIMAIFASMGLVIRKKLQQN
ncbi:copper amine oxidase [Metabacillus litoralis]|uniref:Copper amine oxidase n=1 Tax=Metabacillus litoralis TaxID=152268 RepID=A0A5C6VWF7_9BACI|nr:copper amine oxidase [Metabacillus litoralis]TXC89767.1 copper amine oxidase [Metabacillus litoralis]